MIAGLDSATPPTPAQARAAAAHGVALWSGYLQTRVHVGLYRPWSQADFDAARLCGSTPIAFCSGWDDPVACKALAAAWDVRLCLDVEGGIRADGAWVQPWLNASGAGLYGNAPVHIGKRGAFHIWAGYPGSDPRATWGGRTRPPVPTGWQWEGTHMEFGLAVDRGWYDDWFAGLHGANTGGDDVAEIDTALQHGPDYFTKEHPGAWANLVTTHWSQLMTKLDAIASKPGIPISPQLEADIHTIAEYLRNQPKAL